MDKTRSTVIRRAGQGGIAVAAAAMLVGAMWRGSAAATAPTTPQVSAVSTAQAQAGRAAAFGRDSYADVVDVVAPAVVTIRTEGRARVSPT